MGPKSERRPQGWAPRSRRTTGGWPGPVKRPPGLAGPQRPPPLRTLSPPQRRAVLAPPTPPGIVCPRRHGDARASLFLNSPLRLRLAVGAKPPVPRGGPRPGRVLAGEAPFRSRPEHHKLAGDAAAFRGKTLERTDLRAKSPRHRPSPHLVGPACRKIPAARSRLPGRGPRGSEGEPRQLGNGAGHFGPPLGRPVGPPRRGGRDQGGAGPAGRRAGAVHAGRRGPSRRRRGGPAHRRQPPPRRRAGGRNPGRAPAPGGPLPLHVV